MIDLKSQSAIRTYVIVLAFAALGAGLSDNLLSNYFKDAYQVTALQRGLLEVPRETPGMISVFLMSILSIFDNLRVAAIAQALMIIGLAFLGLLTPPYALMILFVFIHSLGGHLWYPLSDSIGMSLIRPGSEAGRIVGRFKGVSTAFAMLAAIVVFVGFRLQVFSFVTSVKTVFLLAMICFMVVIVALVRLQSLTGSKKKTGRFRLQLPRIRFYREYRYYYLLAIVFGVQKQIMFVFAPWVLIELLEKKTDTIALLAIIGSFIGIFFIPALGRWLDRFGIRTMLYIDALSFILVYLAYGFLSAGFKSGSLARSGLPVILLFALFIIDRMSMQMSLIRSLYLRSIARTPADIAPTLSLGQSMDHVVSILCASLGGLVWSVYGPQYVFFLAALLSGINLAVARLAVIEPSVART